VGDSGRKWGLFNVSKRLKEHTKRAQIRAFSRSVGRLVRYLDLSNILSIERASERSYVRAHACNVRTCGRMGACAGGRASMRAKKLKNREQKFKKRTPHREYESFSFRVRSREMGI